jgi:hypothetical protein
MTPLEKAQAGRVQIEEAILDLLVMHKDGLRNVDVARYLALESPKGQPQKNRLVWELLLRLINQGQVFEARDGRSPRYYAVRDR